MAQDTIRGYLTSWFFEITATKDEKTQQYIELARRHIEQAQGISSRSCTLRHKAYFNHRQCEYLSEKLKQAVDSANSFVEQITRDHHFSFPDLEHVENNRLEMFKLLLISSQEVENFIQDCCKDEWIQAVVLSSNVSGHISPLGFLLELCIVLFEYETKRKTPRRSWSLTEVDDIFLSNVEGFHGLRTHELARTSSGFHFHNLCTVAFYERKKQSARRSLTLAEVDGMFKSEAQGTKQPAVIDMETLWTDLDVVRETRKENSSQYQMAALMLERLERSRLMPAGDPPESSTSNLSERVFSSVKPLESLGKGSAATVYKARWHGADVAMKVFEGPNNHDFQKEVSVLEGLSHPNIISVFCSTIGNRKSSIVMELMDRDLYSLMDARCEARRDGTPFGILEGVDIMLQIGGGMSYLHEMRIVHRDLKSMNILVRTLKTAEVEYVVAKVADFGLSKMKEKSMTYTIQTLNMGTTRWMAPEMLKSQNDESQNAESQKERADGEAMIASYPFKCDIYSFGMVCYEILTGYQPFYDVFPVTNVKRMVLEGQRPTLPDQCPEQLRSLIEKCWSADAGKRPSFGDICAELRHLKYALLMKSCYNVEVHW